MGFLGFGGHKCRKCGGSGQINHRKGNFSDIRGGVDYDYDDSDTCPDCDGTGEAGGGKSKETSYRTCPVCGGSGNESRYDSDNDKVNDVRNRHGGFERCSRCHGSGEVSS